MVTLGLLLVAVVAAASASQTDGTHICIDPNSELAALAPDCGSESSGWDPTVPDCDYQLDSTLFMRIVHGVTDLRAAFLAGKVKVRGDTELALKFGALLGQYYHRIDEHVIAELTA